MAPNQHLLQRLQAVQAQLNAAHAASSTMSSSSRGSEREEFIREYLRTLLPATYRFGKGDATDAVGNRSGQLDIVIETGFVPSIPIAQGNPESRLYLAEGIAAVIEVKSDLSKQWSEVVHTSAALGKVKQSSFGGMASFGGVYSMPAPGAPIPLFAAGYKGWSQQATLESYLSQGVVDGILVVDTGLFVSSARFRGLTAQGPWALWGLISCLHQATTWIGAAGVDPLVYAR